MVCGGGKVFGRIYESAGEVIRGETIYWRLGWKVEDEYLVEESSNAVVESC